MGQPSLLLVGSMGSVQLVSNSCVQIGSTGSIWPIDPVSDPVSYPVSDGRFYWQWSFLLRYCLNRQIKFSASIASSPV